MNPHCGLILALLLTLAACTDQRGDVEIAPIIPPLSPATVQQAEAGDAAAQFDLAKYYLAMEQPEPMLHWLHESARHGYPAAQTSLGVLYYTGEHVPQDLAMAHAWFVQAADQGDAESFVIEGLMSIELVEHEVRREREAARKQAPP